MGWERRHDGWLSGSVVEMMEKDRLLGDAAGGRRRRRSRMLRVVGLDVVLMPEQRTTRVSSLTFTWVHSFGVLCVSYSADEPFSFVCLSARHSFPSSSRLLVSDLFHPSPTHRTSHRSPATAPRPVNPNPSPSPTPTSFTDLTDRLITAKDHASIQIRVADVDADGKAIKDQATTIAICGRIRAQGDSDDSINRIATKEGRE
jgi:hypothetical protein